MSRSHSWKLLPLAFLFALGVFALLPGTGAQRVSADVSSVAIDGDVTSGGTVDVTVTLTASTSNVTISVDGDATDMSLTLTDCNPNCTSEEGETGDSISVSTNNLTQITLTLTATCEDTETVTVTATQGTGEAETSEEDTVNCIPFEGNVTITKEAGTSTADFSFTISGTSTECDQSFSLSDGESQGFACDEGGTYTVTEAASTGAVLTAIDCTDSGIPDADINRDVAARSVTFTIGSGDSIECTFTNSPGTATPTPTGTPAAASQATVSAAPTSLNCSGSSFITAVFRDAAGNPVANGTVVNVTTNIGSVNPSQATTNGGSVLVLFTAPASSGGTATITASAGGISGSAQVAVNCSAATATTAPPPPVATQPPTGGIRPPSTGDAGLAGGDSTRLYGGIALIAVSLFGALAVVRSRAR